MEAMLAIAIGLLSSCGVYLMLRARTFPVILGLTLLSYAVNLFLFASGRLVVNAPPIISAEANHYTDPIPQALVLTAIVIGFGMTAYIVTLALRGLSESGGDHVDMPEIPDDDTSKAAIGNQPPAARQKEQQS
ncbi:MAG: Na+/H+ antiporter subunit C [Betaproteobacteria bacterium HGW-Betaproteobacteria-1]|jgi:multicomponent K+:H+ antiporter subunit C|nr:MAG: Na+/H+ antiporter subunit C [Betaproteobacteria bacterium HGW-Betaproteobacteria-1]